MAFCLKCKAEMDTLEPACPTCGYEIPAREAALIETRTLESAALVLGILGAGLSAAWLAILAVARESATALFVSFILVGLMGVFLRIKNG